MRRGEQSQQFNNRAEEVRKRRTSRSQQRVNTASSRVVNPVLPSRPVTFRGNDFGTPVHRQSNQRPRRQFYVTVDQAAGAELRLPAIPLMNPGWRLLSLIIVIATAVGIFSMMNSPFFRIYTVSVSGLQRLTAEDVNAVVDLNNLSILEVNASEVQAAVVKSFPELMDVQLEVSMPNTVSIHAVERQPVMAFMQDEKVLWVDQDGVLFPARGDAGPLPTVIAGDDLPLAPAPIAEEDKDKGSSTAAVDDALPSSVIPGLLEPQLATATRKLDIKLLTAAQGLTNLLPPDVELVYNKENGLGWNDPQGWAVYIGRDLTQFEEKFDTYQEIVNKLTAEGQRPVIISVAHVNAPFYRLEQ